MNGKNVYILDSAIVPDSKECEVEAELLKDVAKLSLLHLRNEDEFLPYASSADVVIMWHHINLTRRSISQLGRTQVIVRNGVGTDNVDLGAAQEFKIPVCNVPDYGTEEVADHALAMILSLWRQLRPLGDSVRNGVWDWRAGRSIRRIRGATLGIIGCGRIGTATARRARILGFDVIFYDPYVPSGYEKALAVQRTETLDELLRRADVLSLHVPLTDKTFHMIGMDEFRIMKSSAYLVNTSRGPVVDEKSLVEVMKSGGVAGVALDVVESEPHVPRELFSHPNCIITPHAAFYSIDSLKEMREKSARIARDVLQGRDLRNVVTAP